MRRISDLPNAKEIGWKIWSLVNLGRPDDYDDSIKGDPTLQGVLFVMRELIADEVQGATVFINFDSDVDKEEAARRLKIAFERVETIRGYLRDIETLLRQEQQERGL